MLVPRGKPHAVSRLIVSLQWTAGPRHPTLRGSRVGVTTPIAPGIPARFATCRRAKARRPAADPARTRCGSHRELVAKTTREPRSHPGASPRGKNPAGRPPESTRQAPPPERPRFRTPSPIAPEEHGRAATPEAATRLRQPKPPYAPDRTSYGRALSFPASRDFDLQPRLPMRRILLPAIIAGFTSVASAQTSSAPQGCCRNHHSTGHSAPHQHHCR